MDLRRRICIAAAVALVAVLGAGVFVFVRLMSPAHRFLAYVHRYGTDWRSSKVPGRPARDLRWIEGNSDQVVAAGRRACAWLSERPEVSGPAQWQRYGEDVLARRYAKTHHDVPLARVTRFWLTGGAWVYLCPGTMHAHTVEFDGD